MSVKIPIKRGATFSLNCQWRRDDGDTDLTGVDIKSELRSGRALVAQLSVDVVDAAAGLFTLFAPAYATETWPVGLVSGDIRYEAGGVVLYTDSYVVQIIDSQTRPA